MRNSLCVSIFLILLIGCKKEVVKVAPTLNSGTTTASISSTTATISGNITDDGGDPVTARGVVYGLNPNPTISDSKAANGTGIGNFTSTISGLTPGKTYYFRTFATNSIGTTYGEQITLSAPAVMSTITTTIASSVSSTTATSGGTITDDGGSPITARGVCWGTTANPTVSLSTKTTDGTGIGTFTSAISGLSPGVTYYARAYSTNSIGTSYGDQITILATAVVATVTTTAASAISSSSAASGGSISSDGGSPITTKGVCWSTSQNPTITLSTKTTDGTGTASFTSAISGLSSNTTYYVRAYATNSIGTSYGSQITFTTSAVAPTVTTASITAITSTTATGGGNVTLDGGATITARGICWSSSTGPTIALTTKTTDNTGTGAFTSLITGLAPGTTYYVRAYATNSAGTSYGNEISFNSNSTSGLVFNPGLTYGSINDVDGNSYKTIQIGSQLWMAENLKTTKYKDNTAIPLVTSSTWINTTTPAYCWYNNDLTTYKSTYGALYNWYAVNTGKLCPSGWRVPSGDDWVALTDYLGTSAGGKLKETGTSHWTSPNTGATNQTGFTAIPGGERFEYGLFKRVGSDGIWWTSETGYAIIMLNNNVLVSDLFTDNEGGYSVRCISGETTQPTVNAPSVSTTAITNLTATSAVCGGTISSDGGANVSARGVCWATSPSPTTAGNKTTDGNGTGTFTSTISGLVANTIYYVRAYATNSAGTAYGSEVTISTYSMAVISTTAVTSITSTTAMSGGTITSGLATVTANGLCWSTSQNPTILNFKTSIGLGNSAFGSMMTGLTPGTTYYVRAYATNPGGTAYGTQVSFTTTSSGIVVPTLTTLTVTSITTTTATGGGNVSSDGGASVTARGICYSINQNPNITDNGTISGGNGTGAYTCNLIGLGAGTTYYVRAYATNSAGTAYGTQVSFTTQQLSGSTVSDYDGNTYTQVTIGTQIWMASNLKTTKYNDGTAIPLVTDNASWSNLLTPGYCWYNNDAATNKNTYGALYNWYTVDTGKLCPTGWHVSTDAEWTILTTYLGGYSGAGGLLKESGTTHWLSPNVGATNSKNFTALPGGYRNYSGAFAGIGMEGYWWSYGDRMLSAQSIRHIDYGSYEVISSSNGKEYGFSVRCLKD